jgi:hypothetical protein
MNRLPPLQAELKAAKAAAEDFVLIGTLGLQVKALEQVSAQLPLSEQDYRTLPTRHAALVQRVTDHCRQLAVSQDYGALSLLSVKLKELKALDLAGILETREEDGGGANDPIVVGTSEDDGANDPVVVFSVRS